MKPSRIIIFIALILVILIGTRIHKNNVGVTPTTSSGQVIADANENLPTPSQTTAEIKGTGSTFSLKSGDYEFNLSVNGQTRKYFLHVPSSYDTKNATPLILAFHGGTGSAEYMRDNYGLVEKSNKEGFIIAFPNGASRFPSGKIATWNAGDCCGYAIDSKSDDVGFIKAAVTDIKNKFNVSKIFATGMSNGGMFSYRLACDMPGTFTAIAAVSGTDNYPTCNPKDPVSIFHVHSLQDTHVLYNGGCGPDCMIRSETEFVSVPSTISKWVARNSCSQTPQRVFENENAYCDLYSSCTNGAQVKLCTTKDGGHSWPGLSTPSGNSLEKSLPSQAINATNEIWDFFKSKIQ